VLEQLIIEAQAKGLKLIVCCENLEEAEKLLALKPYGIAFEDKDLIGSGQSITTAKAEDVKKFISMVKGKSKAIIGAGISTGEDVRSGIEFGADGFILASAFVKATDRKAKAIELVTPFLV
jgi:triosephosphate isomerase